MKMSYLPGSMNFHRSSNLFPYRGSVSVCTSTTTVGVVARIDLLPLAHGIRMEGEKLNELARFRVRPEIASLSYFGDVSLVRTFSMKRLR